MVAVMCSEDAEKVSQKNNLSFVEMVRPFCHLTSEGNKIRIIICSTLSDYRSTKLLQMYEIDFIRNFSV